MSKTRTKPGVKITKAEGESPVARMTTGERQGLERLVRLRAKIAKSAAKERAAWLRADVEAKLAAIYKFDDERWAEFTKQAQKRVAELDAEIGKICQQHGISG